jgi:hypothetical protein
MLSFLLLSVPASVTCFELEAYFTNWTITGGVGANMFVADEQTSRNLTLPDDAVVRGTTADPELRLISDFSIPVVSTNASSIGVFMRVTVDTTPSIFPRNLVTFKGENNQKTVRVGVRPSFSKPRLDCVISLGGTEVALLDCWERDQLMADEPLAILFHQRGLVEVRVDGKTLSRSTNEDGGGFSSAQSVSIAGTKNNDNNPLFVDDLAVFVFGEDENIDSQLQDLINGKKPTPATPAPPTPRAVVSTTAAVTLISPTPKSTSTLTQSSGTPNQPASSPTQTTSSLTPKATPGPQLSPPTSSALVSTSSGSGTNGVDSSPSDAATIVGAAAGSVAFLCLAAAIVGVVLYFRKKKADAASPSAPSNEMAMTRPASDNYGAAPPLREYGDVTDVQAPSQNYGNAPKLHNHYDAVDSPLDI